MANNNNTWFIRSEETDQEDSARLVLYKKGTFIMIPPKDELFKSYNHIFDCLKQGWQELDISTATSVPLSSNHCFTSLFIKFDPLAIEKNLIKYLADYYGWHIECNDTFHDHIRQTSYSLTSLDGHPERIYLAIMPESVEAVCNFLDIKRDAESPTALIRQCVCQ